MRTPKRKWERSLLQLQKLGQLSAAAHGRATAAREALASIEGSTQGRSDYIDSYSALLAYSQASDVAYLRASTHLLKQAARDRRPPAYLSRPWHVAHPLWVAIVRRPRAIWRTIPKGAPEFELGILRDHPAVVAVAAQAELLRTSRLAKHVRGSSALYEITRPTGPDGSRAPAGMRIRPGKEEETRQLHTDRYSVWNRARAYGDAAQVLLVEWRNGATT